MSRRSKGRTMLCGKVVFFLLWLLLWLASIELLLWNVQWHITSISEKIMAVVITIGLAILLVDVMEGMAMAIMAIFLFGRPRKERIGDSSGITAILNYNLLAYCKKDIDDCYERMYEAFLGNLSESISAVLLSVTPDADLRRYELECRDKYRMFVKNTLLTEGNCYLKHETDHIEFVRLVNLWRKAEDRYGRRYLETNLEKFCQKISREFMCIHRVSKVLRKCGQYQDLMLLSDGYPNAFTYCDKEFYGPYARPIGQPLFHDTDDVRNIYRRKFHYTFVLDGDTRVQPGVAHSLLNIAVKKPEKGIIQPSIKFEVTIWDTIYMHLEDLRAKLNKPMANVMPRVLGQCGFFGKALINNRIYIDSIIGHPNQVLEKVPVNALSHDTYEGAILKPYYVSNVSFIERPVYNYLAWNSRLRRWNLGDLILLTYFSYWFGRMIRSFQACAQKKDYFHVKVRTPVKFDFVSSYVAHSSIRSIFLKPYWCVFVIVYTAALGTKLYYRWVPIIVVLIIIVIFSKIPLLLHCGEAIMYIIPELLSSIVQFTAEIVVGVVRIIRVFHALIVGRKKQIWVPQRFVEEEFNTVNVWKIWVYSWKHLWGYAVFGLVLIAVMIVLSVFAIIDPVIYILIIFDLATIAAIPLFCFITSLRICPCCHTKKETDSDKVSLYSPSTLDSGYIDTKDSTILIPIEEDRPRRAVTKHAEIWIDPPEPTMYREEVPVTRADQRRRTERIGSENIYEEILVPLDNSRHVGTSYQLIDDDTMFDALSLKRSKKHRQVETYEEMSDNWREHGKDNPVYDETLEDEYIQVVESEPAFTKTVYRHVNETQKQSDTAYEDPVSYQGQAEVYEEIQDVEELRKEAELREALMTLDSAITGTKQHRRIKTDGASTRYVRTKQAVSERSPVNVIDRQISYQTERGPPLASGDRIDSDFSKYIMMQPRSEYVNTETIVDASPSRFMQERSDTHTHEQEDSRIRTTSAEIWPDKGTLSSLITDSTFLDEDESISYENMDVQTWLRSNQADAIHPQSTKTYENIPLQTQSITTRDYKTIGSIPEVKERSYIYENTQRPKTPEPVSYRARYGSTDSESEIIEQTTTATYENVPRETTRIVSRDSGDYQTVLDYGTTPPIPGGKEKPFTYGKIEDRVMSEGTLIDHKLSENLAQWHKAMEKTMLPEKHELPVERSRASNVMTSERLAASGAVKIPMPPPRQDSMVTYTTQCTFNILPKESVDVRRDVLQEEPATTEYVQSNFTNVTIDSSSSDDEIATKKFSRKVTRDLQDQPSYTIVTERAVSPQKLTPGKVPSSQSHQTEYMIDKVVKERAVSPQRYVSVERSVSPHRMVSVERVASPQRETVYAQKMVVDERAVSPDRSVTVARSVSPQRLVSVKRVASPHRETQYAEDMVVGERTVSPERFISLERARSHRRMVTVKRVVSPGDHGIDYEREKNVALTGRSRSQNRQGDDEPHADRYETQNSETYEIIRRSVSPRNLQTDSDDSSEDVIVNTREVRVLHDPIRETEKLMKMRSHKIMKERSASPQNREDFTKAAVLRVIDTRDINKKGVKSVFTGAAKVPEKALNVDKEKRKKTKDAMKDKLGSAKDVVKDKVGNVAGVFGEVNLGGGASGKLAQEEKDDWMLKYEKKKAKKALKADKDSQNQ